MNINMLCENLNMLWMYFFQADFFKFYRVAKARKIKINNGLLFFEKYNIISAL